LKDSFKNLDAEKVEKLLNDDERADKLVRRQFEVIVKEFEKDLKKNAPANLLAHRQTADAFRRNHNRTWKKPIDLLEIFIFIQLELQEKYYQAKKGTKNDAKLFLQFRLHAKALRTSFEILELLKGGFADGAMGRWRTLYETAIIASFISQHDQQLARQFLDYSVVQEYKDALEFQKNCTKLGYRPYTKRQIQIMERRVHAMVAQYGAKFKKETGWLLNYLPEPFSFKAIEENTNFSHFRSYYKLANHRVHSGPQSVLLSLGSLNSNKWIPAGASNFGIADPGRNTAKALLWASHALLSDNQLWEPAVYLTVSAKLGAKIGEEFFAVQNKIESEEKALNSRKRNEK
jgi:hypothetical protein